MKSGRSNNIKRIFGIIGKTVLFILVFAIAVLPAVFMNTVYGYFPIFFLVTVLLVSFICMMIQKKGIRVIKENQKLVCKRNSGMRFGIGIKNNSVLVCSSAEGVFTISDLFGRRNSERRIPFAAGPKSTVSFDLGLEMKHVGVYEAGLNEVRIHDITGFLTGRIKESLKFSAIVTPVNKSLSDLDILNDAYSDTDRNTRSVTAGGTDYTGVREYVPGDPMKQIHWKLSAHSRNYLTKLQERNLLQTFSVICDFTAADNFTDETLMDMNDCLVESTFAVIKYLKEKDLSCRLVYANKKSEIVHVKNTDEDNLPEIISDMAMITPKPGTDFPKGADILMKEADSYLNAGNIVVLTTYASAELQQEMAGIKASGHGLALYLIVPAAYTSRDLERVQAQMVSISEAGIPCTLISTAVNGGTDIS